MDRDRQIDLIEGAMRNAYSEEIASPEFSDTWQSTLMNHIAGECSPEDAEITTMEKEFLYFSWIAAGIAAALIIISSITNVVKQDTLENDINELYSDNTLNSMITAMVTK